MEIQTKPSAFQIKPDLENIIPPLEVKKIISQILNDTLLSKRIQLKLFKKILNSHLIPDKTYTTEHAKIWTKSIADDINRNLNHLTQRYKHVVQVVITQKLGQGFKFIARNRWDPDADRQISESFVNDSIICVATVFGVYLY